MDNIVKELVEAALSRGVNTEGKLQNLKNRFSERFKINTITNQEIVQVYQALLREEQISRNREFEEIIKKRKIRSLSGVAVITVLTKAYPCPGKCVFCPTEMRMPKSYLSNEPAAMRALLNDFDPYKQVTNRLRALEISGHNTDKIELIVLGGTFSSYPKRYQKDFVRQCFNALNGEKKERSLQKAQKKNETAKHRVVSLSLETRPDHVTKEEICHFRELGCTKIQLGVQHLDNDILDYVKRGHHVEESIRAIRICKDAGLKVCLHMMPNLPGSNPEKDLQMFQELFQNPAFRPDFLKVYPCVVTPFSELAHWFKKGEYKSYSNEVLEKLLVSIKKTFPRYVRVDRLIRDIPGESILEGSKITNLRQELQRKYPDLNCQCIRCREIRNDPVNMEKIQFEQLEYEASEGKEFFLSFTHGDKNKNKICALLRLRFHSQKKHFIPELNGASIIREIHTYGLHLNLGSRENESPQHLGLGKKLIAKAEEISKAHGFRKIAVISSIGTREYYRKLGYHLGVRSGKQYMFKSLTTCTAFQT